VASLEQVRADFDRIATLPEASWDHNAHHYGWIQRQLSLRPSHVLEVGCGTGALARLLAHRAERVTAIDLSSEMIRVARSRATMGNLRFEVADIMTWSAAQPFDAVITVSTLHHLPLETGLSRLRDLVRPGGRLVVLDLFQAATPADQLANLMSMPISAGLRLLHERRLLPPRAVRDAWEEHGARDRYPTIAQVRAIADHLVPGARVRRHLLWRYSLVWERP
jgi:SAM-dependent methyltransferase